MKDKKILSTYLNDLNFRLLILNLMENCYQCYHPGCGVPVGHGYQALVEHMEREHSEDISNSQVESFNSWKEFDFVFVLSGRGHKEKNMLNILFDFHWEPVIEHICESIGLCTPKQKLLIRKVKDHHKGWDVLMILSQAIEQELAYIIL